MPLSATPECLETCTLNREDEFLQKYVGKEVMRIISTTGIPHPGIEEGDEKDFDAIVEFFIPSYIRSHPSSIELGTFTRGLYTLQIDPSHEGTVSYKLTLTKNSPN